MEKKYMERLVGKYCKIVTKEPGEERASVVTGILEDVDYKDGFVLVDSKQGLGCLRINTIVAIKPRPNKEVEMQYKRSHTKTQHKKHYKNARYFKNNNKGAVGIGTLIVFIAMILVAAVAASVIISTAETLQQRAKTVGTSVIREVSAGLVIEDIAGYTNVNKTEIQYLAFLVRPRAGTQDIDLKYTVLTIKYNNLSILKLNTSLITEAGANNTSVFDTPVIINGTYSNFTIINNCTSTEYGAISVLDADGSVLSTQGFNDGDRVYILVNLTALIPESNGLPTRGTISGELQPETGAPGVFEFTSPSVYAKRIVELW